MKEQLPVIRIVSGVASGGKGTIYPKIYTNHPECMRLVSLTARAKRPNEQDGIEYYFVTKEEFERHITKGKMFEYELIWGEYYGTPLSTFHKAAQEHKVLLAQVDVRGVENMFSKFSDVKGIFLDCDPKIQRERFIQRGVSMDTIKIRLEGAKREREHARKLQETYPGLYKVIDTSNHSPEETLQRAEEFLFKNSLPF